MTLETAILLATKAHEGQWRRPITVPKSVHNLPTALIEAMNRGELDVYEHNGNLYTAANDGDKLIQKAPYISHPLAIMEMMKTEEEKKVAVLHDVVEDCKDYFLEIDHVFLLSHTPEKGKATRYSLTKDEYEALELLTKKPGQSYMDYILAIITNPLARKVKLADIFHNLASNPSEKQKKKYLEALSILLGAL